MIGWLGLAAVTTSLVFAKAPPDERRYFQMSDEQAIDALIQKDYKKAPDDLKRRISMVSERFLGTPYRLEALGEGPEGDFDRDPTMNFHALDCTTFVEHVMAISLEPDLARARATLQKIRYKDGVVQYDMRNHFPEIDWIPNNEASGYLRDITREVAGEKTRTVSRMISKRDWYAQKDPKDLSAGFDTDTPEQRAARVKRWRELGSKYKDQEATLDYLPIEYLPEFVDRIPSGTIVNLIREPSKQEAYPILVSHQALVIDTPRGKMIRNAAFGRAVEDTPALAYFYKFFNVKWRLLGINLNEITAPSPRH